MRVEDYIRQFDDRDYFAWDRFIPMVFMMTNKSSEIKKLMIEGLDEHNKIASNRADKSVNTPKIVVKN